MTDPSAPNLHGIAMAVAAGQILAPILPPPPPPPHVNERTAAAVAALTNNHKTAFAVGNGEHRDAEQRDEREEGEGEEAEEEEDAEDRLARSRERNREHARRTRLRKKAQLRALQARVKELQDEGRVLRQTVEECSIASILLGLSSGQQEQEGGEGASPEDLPPASSSATAPRVSDAMNFNPTLGGKRKRFLLDANNTSPQPMKLRINGRLTEIGGDNGKAHINWKTGVFCDEDGLQKQLSPEELEALRRERNRMHAKMTRDRKKNFISTVERTINELERENKKMREILARQARHHFAGRTVTPDSTPRPSLAAAVVPVAAAVAPAGGRPAPPPLVSLLPAVTPIAPLQMPGVVPLAISSPPALSVESATTPAAAAATKTQVPIAPAPVMHGFSVVA